MIFCQKKRVMIDYNDIVFTSIFMLLTIISLDIGHTCFYPLGFWENLQKF